MVIGGGRVVERFNRTLQENIQTRLGAMGLDRDKWVSQLEPIINKYNNTEQTTTKMKPTDARKEDSQLMVSFNLLNNAKRNRKYPDLTVGSEVRVMVNNTAHTKGYFAKWSPTVYKITHIKNYEYLLNDGKRKVYQRFEILKL